MESRAKMDYPCMKESQDNKYYQGDSQFEVCSRCEYRDNLYDFIRKNYSQFTLLKCCERKVKNVSHPESRPEAIFVDRNDIKNMLAIEVKSINKLYAKDKKDNDFITGQNFSFDKKRLDEIEDVLMKALENALLDEQCDEEKKFLYYYFLSRCTHVHFKYDNKNRCTFKEIFLKVGKNEISKIYNQLFHCFKEFYMSIVRFLSGKESNETSMEMDWELMWEIDGVQYAFNLEIFLTEEHSAITWDDYNPYSEWKPNSEILLQLIEDYYQECEKKFLCCPDSRHVLLLKNESRYFTMYILKVLNEIKKPDYIDEIWLSEYECEEIYDEDGEFIEEKKVGICYKKIG